MRNDIKYILLKSVLLGKVLRERGLGMAQEPEYVVFKNNHKDV
jgi:hypothetical protein